MAILSEGLSSVQHDEHHQDHNNHNGYGGQAATNHGCHALGPHPEKHQHQVNGEKQ